METTGVGIEGPILEDVQALYRKLHQRPELAFHEQHTARKLASWLHQSGFALVEGIARTGVVGVLRNGVGPTIAIRAAMDAIAGTESTGLPWASTVPGAAHTCGHDVQVACLAAAARLLAAGPEHWRGTLVIIGQPAEETYEGARAMLADGLFERTARPDAILGQHLLPGPAGTLLHRPSSLMSHAGKPGETPSVHSDLRLEHHVLAAHRACFGEEKVVELDPGLAEVEDFAWYGIPGPETYGGDPIPIYAWGLGGTPKAVWDRAEGETFVAKMHHVPANHDPAFAPDPEPTLSMGVAALVCAALDRLAQ